MISDEPKLCYDCEIKFGHVIKYRVHRPNGRGNLAFSHYGGIGKKWEALNMHGCSIIKH